MTFDLSALKVDDERPPFKFTWDGDEYEISAEVDVLVPVLMQNHDLHGAFVRLLGQEAFAKIAASPTPFRKEHLAELFKQYSAHAGADLGKASPQRKRSKSTQVK